jgi:hypothetical protein
MARDFGNFGHLPLPNDHPMTDQSGPNSSRIATFVTLSAPNLSIGYTDVRKCASLRSRLLHLNVPSGGATAEHACSR